MLLMAPSTSAREPSGMVATKVHWVTPRSPRDEVVRVGPLTVGEHLQDLREALVLCAVHVGPGNSWRLLQEARRL